MRANLTFEPRTDQGLERTENQDAFGSARFDEIEFFFVCDGMGGHAGGQLASRLAVEIMTLRLADPAPSVRERVSAAILDANSRILEHANANRELRGMGTTAVLVAIEPESRRVHVAHVGDSRAYLVRGNVMRRLTRDHTMVQRLIDDGIIPPEAAKNHPNSNIISRSLGSREGVEIEFVDDELIAQDGDIFVLCSDGLHGLVEEHEVAQTVATRSAADAADRLIERAREEGGHDNITVEVIAVGERTGAPPDAFDIAHPLPAPGTRLAMAAEAAQAAASQAVPAVEVAADDETPELAPATVHDDRPHFGLAIVVGAVTAVVLIIALFVRPDLRDGGEADAGSGDGSAATDDSGSTGTPSNSAVVPN
jgi:protein phosphatase